MATENIPQRITELRASNTPEVDVNAWIKGAQDFPFALTWTLFTFIGILIISVFYAGAIGRMMIKKYPKLSA